MQSAKKNLHSLGMYTNPFLGLLCTRFCEVPYVCFIFTTVHWAPDAGFCRMFGLGLHTSRYRVHWEPEVRIVHVYVLSIFPTSILPIGGKLKLQELPKSIFS